MKLSPIQEKIVETPGNLIVRASAGTGKTHTMVNKIAKEIDDNHTHKVIAAITFTIKAAQEIKDRLSVDVVQHFIGSRTHRAATSDIRSDFWQESRRIPCIYLKQPLIYCPMPLI